MRFGSCSNSQLYRLPKPEMSLICIVKSRLAQVQIIYQRWTNHKFISKPTGQVNALMYCPALFASGVVFFCLFLVVEASCPPGNYNEINDNNQDICRCPECVGYINLSLHLHLCIFILHFTFIQSDTQVTHERLDVIGSGREKKQLAPFDQQQGVGIRARSSTWQSRMKQRRNIKICRRGVMMHQHFWSHQETDNYLISCIWTVQVQSYLRLQTINMLLQRPLFPQSTDLK